MPEIVYTKATELAATGRTDLRPAGSQDEQDGVNCVSK